jgi:hypothetical protein
MTSHSSIESRARQLANSMNRDQLLDRALQARKEKKISLAYLYFRAVRVFDEDRSLMASIAGADYMGNAVYDLRPRRLPSDGLGIER